jgi:hypothetical protein
MAVNATTGLKMNDLIAVEKIAQWERLKTLVLDSVFSPITKRVYNMALNEFMAWFAGRIDRRDRQARQVPGPHRQSERSISTRPRSGAADRMRDTKLCPRPLRNPCPSSPIFLRKVQRVTDDPALTMTNDSGPAVS